MMKSRKGNLPVEEVDMEERANAQYLELEITPIEEEADSVCAMLRRMGSRSTCGYASFAYQDLESDDYVGDQALHRVVEDLQFGHDLRL